MRTNEIELTKYRDFRPTQFDPAGLGCEDLQDWLVTPVGHNRDSGTLEESNWHVALDMLGGEGSDVEVHRFGHWGPGWFEIILVRPGSDAHRIAQEIAASLADYPILSDDDYGMRELDAAYEWWMHMGLKERIRVCAKYRESVFAARHDEIPERVDISYLADGC